MAWGLSENIAKSRKQIDDNCVETESRGVCQPWSKLLEKNWSDITRESKNVMKLPMFAVWCFLKWGPLPPTKSEERDLLFLILTF